MTDLRASGGSSVAILSASITGFRELTLRSYPLVPALLPLCLLRDNESE